MCPAGHECPLASRSASVCAVGKFSPSEGSEACAVCLAAPGYFCPAGSTSALGVACVEGYTSAGGSDSCHKPPSSGPPLGAIVGGVIGALLVATASVFTAKWLKRRRAREGNPVRTAQGSGPLDVQVEDDFTDLRVFPVETVRRALVGLESIAEGGSAEVFRTQLHGRTVAVKAIRTGSMASTYAAGFRQEISILGSCRHPNVVELVGYSTEPDTGSLWLVYPWMNGGDLQVALERRGLALTDHERVKICVDVADGLMFCHNGCGGILPGTLLHRDVKPANILLSIQTLPGSLRAITARLGDFGLSKLYETREGDQHWHTRQPFGTPGYIAPELASGLVAPNGKADVYAFGVVILQVATGLNYRVDTGGGVMSHISSQPLTWLRAHMSRPWSNAAALDHLLEVGIACTAIDTSRRLDLATARRRLASALVANTREARECLLCYERPRNARILSCGHMSLCMECAQTVAAAGFPCLVCQAAFTLANVAAAEPGEATFLPQGV